MSARWVYIIIVYFSGVLHNSYAQVALLDRAYEFIEKKDYVRAEEALLQAEKHITTANDARTFYLKAFVYKEIMVNHGSTGRQTTRRAALDNLKRCEQLDVDGSFNVSAKQLRQYLMATLYNEASNAYNNQDYTRAIAGYREYLAEPGSKNDVWLLANYFLASAYNSTDSLEQAKKTYETLVVHNYDQPLVFVDLAYIYLAQEDFTNASHLLNIALKKYPEYYEIGIAELNMLSASQQFEVLTKRCEEFLTKRPDDIDVMLMLAGAHMKNKNADEHLIAFDKAVAIYQRILSTDSLNYHGNYNLGVLFYNEAVELVNKNDIDTDIAQLAVLLEKSTSYFEKALPLLLRIYKSGTTDKKLLVALQAIYYNLNMKGELAAINDSIAKLVAK